MSFLTSYEQSDGGSVTEIHYNLDSNEQTVTTDKETTITINTEGHHSLTFWSKGVGNGQEIIEEPRTIEFNIDKTPPEATIAFDKDFQAIQVSATDELSGGVSINPTVTNFKKDNKNESKSTKRSSRQSISYTISDLAGNTLEIPIKITATQSELKATIEKLIYNSQEQVVADNSLHYTWVLDGTNYQQFHQDINIDGNGHLVSTYDVKNGQTTVRTLTQGAKTEKETVSGLQVIKIDTSNGQLDYSY